MVISGIVVIEAVESKVPGMLQSTQAQHLGNKLVPTEPRR
jgi:hypothetical protein